MENKEYAIAKEQLNLSESKQEDDEEKQVDTENYTLQPDIMTVGEQHTSKSISLKICRYSNKRAEHDISRRETATHPRIGKGTTFVR